MHHSIIAVISLGHDFTQYFTYSHFYCSKFSFVSQEHSIPLSYSILLHFTNFYFMELHVVIRCDYVRSSDFTRKHCNQHYKGKCFCDIKALEGLKSLKRLENGKKYLFSLKNAGMRGIEVRGVVGKRGYQGSE